MPHHWGPLPVNTKAVRASGIAVPEMMFGAASCAATRSLDAKAPASLRSLTSASMEAIGPAIEVASGPLSPAITSPL